MKKILSSALAVLLVFSLTACGLFAKEPEDSVYKADVQEYIEDVLDETAQISIFEKKSSSIDGDTLTVVCVAMYSGEAGENKGEFTLTYEKDGKSWELEKCRVALNEENEAGNSENAGNASQEPADTTPEENRPTAISDEWKDFTFELDGELYSLPTHYNSFTANGWKLDGTRSDVDENYMVPGYTRVYVYLTNGAVYFSAEIINMSGHARAVKDCDVGAITVEASDNLGLKIAKGIGCLSTVEDIQTAFGTPSSTNTYSDYSSIKYEADTYVVMSFYVYNQNTTYNEITLRNCVARDRDATTAKEERPAYLDEYVAPTELGSDIKSTRFELDGVVYQLPCSLDAFTNNGWTVKSDSIGTLGAWNEEYGVTLEKNNLRINLSMINLSDFETYTKNCAVSSVSFDGYTMRDAKKDFLKLPGGVNLGSEVEDVESIYKDFTRYDGTSSTSFTYENKDYSEKVRYYRYDDYEYASFDIKNKNWNY